MYVCQMMRVYVSVSVDICVCVCVCVCVCGYTERGGLMWGVKYY